MQIEQFPMSLECIQQRPLENERRPRVKNPSANGPAMIIFQNYVPMSQELNQFVRRENNFAKEVEKEYQIIVNSAVDTFLKDEKAPLKIIPKKSTIDLKNKLKSKFEILNKRTEASIIFLLKQKLEEKEKEREKKEKGEPIIQEEPQGLRNSLIGNESKRENGQMEEEGDSTDEAGDTSSLNEELIRPFKAISLLGEEESDGIEEDEEEIDKLRGLNGTDLASAVLLGPEEENDEQEE